MKKTVILVRHPSYVLTRDLYKQGELDDRDVETFVPIDERGWKMTKYLLNYFRSQLPKILKQGKLGIFTSPIKRSRDMATTIAKGLSTAFAELNFFTEVTFFKKADEALALFERAKQKRMHVVELWFQESPDEIVRKANDHLPLLQKGLEYLQNSATSVDIVFSHRFAIALTIWLIQEKNKGRKDLTITVKDLPNISKITGKMAYTAISQIEFKAGKWTIVSVGQVPHLKKTPELIGGTF